MPLVFRKKTPFVIRERLEARRLEETDGEAFRVFRRGWCVGSRKFWEQLLEEDGRQVGQQSGWPVVHLRSAATEDGRFETAEPRILQSVILRSAFRWVVKTHQDNPCYGQPLLDPFPKRLCYQAEARVKKVPRQLLRRKPIQRTKKRGPRPIEKGVALTK